MQMRNAKENIRLCELQKTKNELTKKLSPYG